MELYKLLVNLLPSDKSCMEEQNMITRSQVIYGLTCEHYQMSGLFPGIGSSGWAIWHGIEHALEPF